MFSAKERTAAIRPDNLRPPYHVAKLDVLFKSVPAVCCLAVEIFPVQFNHLPPKKRARKGDMLNQVACNQSRAFLNIFPLALFTSELYTRPPMNPMTKPLPQVSKPVT